jgi:hypothetical protein|uniref:Uncharacterized protein n=1 Tax=Eutreptiella gymnastica TaxID=73025 RepID=A0A7S4CJB4_9EUGL|eukprot:CAMPEP_0174297510 /NCGR_PEP_ID=MMETSP0809-20121228/51225_1 /TAXON_ID=73025 ORGANISM="Eutreptiella gymnastica-like, Strain CCMP1594" /NCGR_SAMPLE_ID=MMETSP0809 /ASSEMBLY_ACC=CAM_ASM_000658 /LENGTH=552 /DNA_ID=CAMNT_0015401345 /DNA_START=26 /DNA_END=1684 /DNA_ORIENTATION=+
MRAIALLMLAVLLGYAAGVPTLPAWNFALTLRVGSGEWGQAVAEMEALLEFSQEKKMGQNTQLLLRGTLEKMKEKVTELEEAALKAEAKKLKDAAQPKAVAFTPRSIAVKPLKKAMAAKKDLNVKRYTISEAVHLIKENKLSFRKPFIIKNALPELPTLQSKLQAEELMKLTDTKIQYWSPVIAKKRRTFDQKQEGDEEKFEAQMISFEDWFQECFNHKAKPDFKRMPGYGTEHCTQALSAFVLPSEWANFSMSAMAELQMDTLYRMAVERASFVAANSKDIASFTPDGMNLQDELGGGGSVKLTMGSAGSGDQLQRDGAAYFDALVHGRRRWFFIGYDSFMELRDKAAGVLEPASAFQFYEQQFEELREDFGLGGKKMLYYEVNQEVGDLLYIPGPLQRLSLALEDSISLTHEVVPEGLAKAGAWVNSAIFDPAGGVIPVSFSALTCFDFDPQQLASTLGAPMMQGMQAQFVLQIMASNFGQPERQNALILRMISRCRGAAAIPEVEEDTFCKKLVPTCVKKLKANAPSVKASFLQQLRGIKGPEDVSDEL